MSSEGWTGKEKGFLPMGHLCFATQCFASGMVGKGGSRAPQVKV
jgi:hypothetical protein